MPEVNIHNVFEPRRNGKIKHSSMCGYVRRSDLVVNEHLVINHVLIKEMHVEDRCDDASCVWNSSL